MNKELPREQLHYDIVIVGAGPAGLAAACRLRQLNNNLSVCVLEKGAEVGAHILSGAIFETRALDELFPEWKKLGAPVQTEVHHEEWFFLPNQHRSWQLPNALLPASLHNRGNYVISLGQLCRWLAERATDLGVDVFPAFSAHELLFNAQGGISGVVTGDMGRTADNSETQSFTAGVELHAKYTLFCEGARGHLGKQLIAHFALAADKDPQHYALGIKEIWRIPAQQHHIGLVLHSLGWPLHKSNTNGGGFLYHLGDNLVAVGLITDLDYRNPHLSPFEEFQRYKHHPRIAQHLLGGERILYGARAITKGGLQAQPQMYFPGGLLIGDDAGTLNVGKIKGSHTAMKSGMIAAEVIVNALAAGRAQDSLSEYESAYQQSWAYAELHQHRNIAPAQQRWGTIAGNIYAFVDMHLGGKLPWTLHNHHADHTQLSKLAAAPVITYPKPDGHLSFDKNSSVYLSNTYHREHQPCHLQLHDTAIPISYNLPNYGEPAQHYCPAGVYEIVTGDNQQKKLQINAQNCVHCKTCDIKDPSENITWITPEAGGGPHYSQG